MAYALANDANFAAFAKRAEEEEKAAEARRNGSGSSFQSNYEVIKGAGLSTEEVRIVRLVGNPPTSMKPNSDVGPTDAHEIFTGRVINDEGKRVTLRLPLHAEDDMHEHLMWRIIKKVKSVKWVPDPEKPGKNKKIELYANYPWYDKVVHGGYDPEKDDYSYRTSKGWTGQQVIIINCIDREDNWCAENKHTKILSKKVGISKNDDGTETEWPEHGVASFGFVSKLSTLSSQYGSWEKYDLQIKRTGQMQEPTVVKPATIFKKAGLLAELDKSKLDFVSLNDTLTPEELEYERYDIAKYFAPTTYNKILKNFGKTIKAIDVDLNTTFYEELQTLVEKEKEMFKEMYGDNSEQGNAPTSEMASFNESSDNLDPYSQPVQAAPVQSAPVATPVAPAQPAAPARTVTRAATVAGMGLSAEKIALLKGWTKLTEREQGLIADVILNPDNTLQSVVYKEGAAKTVDCPIASGGCGFDSPSDFGTCPVCGASFS